MGGEELLYRSPEEVARGGGLVVRNSGHTGRLRKLRGALVKTSDNCA